MKWYSISRTSRVLNTSSELLRHYERLGLIHPKRLENGYRSFSFKEIDKLQGIRRYRNMNFSLEQMEKLIYTADYDEVGALYAQSVAQTKRNIVWQQELLRATELIAAEWACIPAETETCHLVESPKIRWVQVRRKDSFDEDVDAGRLGEWINHLPVVFISPTFPQEAVLSGGEDVNFGYGVEEAAFSRLGLPSVAQEKRFPACRCVTSIVYSHGEQYIGAHSLAPMVEFCKKEGLTVCGDAWGYTIGNCCREGETYRYHRVYLPVERV